MYNMYLSIMQRSLEACVSHLIPASGVSASRPMRLARHRLGELG
jgi:hypothetical protein